MVKYHVEREYETEAFRHSAKFVCGGAYVCHAVSVLLDASNLSENQSDAFQVPPDLIFMPTLENYEELFVTGSFGRYFSIALWSAYCLLYWRCWWGSRQLISLPVVSFGLRRPFLCASDHAHEPRRSICDSLLYCLQRTGIIGYLYRLDADLFRVKLGNHCVESESFYGGYTDKSGRSRAH